GWIVPVGTWNMTDRGTIDDTLGRFKSLGTNVAPPLRWPNVVIRTTTAKMPNDIEAYNMQYVNDGMLYDPAKYPVEPFTSKVFICPADIDEPFEAHSYIINKHLAKTPDPGNVKKFGSKMGRGLTDSQVPWVGEKPSTVRDYYMEVEHYNQPGAPSEFTRVVEL